MVTGGVKFEFTPKQKAELFAKVREFDSFTEGNNPYGERDFGAFAHYGRNIFWKIDYYGPNLKTHTEDPADRSKTVRVLTVMLAEEY